MDRLYTPWRMKYVSSTQKKSEGCIFCDHLKADPAQDRANYLVYRGPTTFTVMNIFPYNTGHLMILPREHVGTLPEVPPPTQFEMITLTTYFTELLTELMHPDGFNVGLNMGRAAGAGIDGHLHIHLVPRWNGDSNFMPVIGETRVLPEELGDTYDKIVARLKEQPPQIPSLS
ncbi:MAG: HIT domain-containing protein [Anaerolineae bacterium]|nr:HIT domain-containing protein [Anaerolineae bacterium]